MVLTPLDISNKTFSSKMRGYSQDEVDDFLDLIVREYEESIAKNREYEKALKHAEEKLEYFNELKDALNQSIIVAQDTADKVKTSASKESEVIVTSAQNRADELLNDAEKRAYQLTTTAEEKAKEVLTDATSRARLLVTETDDLKKKTRVFHQRLALMLESQLELVKSPEWNEILAPFSDFISDSDVIIREVLSTEFDNLDSDDVNSEEDTAEAIEIVDKELLKVENHQSSETAEKSEDKK